MNKNKIYYFIDLGLALSFFVSFITGVIKYPGLLHTLRISLRSIPMFQISLIHDWGGIIMSILVFTHLVLHWKWIVTMTKKNFQ